MKKEEIAKVSGGWDVAPNGSYWFTDSDIAKLEKAGFEVAGNLKTWEGVEGGMDFMDGRNRVVNYNGERATPEQIAKVLGESLN